MNPTMVRESVAHRLITMRKTVGQLHSLGPVDDARLAGDPAIGLVLERILALLDEVAFAVNREVSVAVVGHSPQTVEASFRAAAQAGLIGSDLANLLAPEDGPHNVQLQMCLDRDPAAVGAVVAAAVSAYDQYIRDVTAWAAAE